MKIDVMTKDKDTKTVVPALRFPEFRDGEGWKRTPILEICEIIGGGTPTSSNDVYWNGDIPWISSSDINENNISEITPTRHITKDAIKNSATKLCKAPSIHIVSRVGVGKVAFSRVDICTSQDFTNLCNINCNYIFLSYLLSIIMKQKVQETQGTSIKGIASAEIKNLHVPLPEIEEQQRIADCLSSLDDLISAVADKIETLKEYKKGLMQQLFPAEGKTIPAIRFPEFQNKGEWEEAILGDYVEIKGRIGYRGYTTNDIVEKGEGAISLSPTNITDNGELIFNKCTYISWGKYNESPEIMLDRGYVVLVKTGSSYGKSALVKQLPQKTTINPQIVILKPQKMNDVFLSLLISHNLIQKQINKAIVGGAIPTLSQDSISKFKILIPKIEEQKKIAEYLLSVDELISTEIAKLDQLKAHKKGLMQQLFPKLQ